MSIGLIGRKVGMTQVFQDDGTMVAVSVVEIEPNTVTRVRTTERDGYAAVQLGTAPVAKLVLGIGWLQALLVGAVVGGSIIATVVPAIRTARSSIVAAIRQD